MARTINCGENVKRSDTHFVDPREVIVNWELNGRTDTFTPEAIARLAHDMHDNGQLQPVACRSMPDRRVQLIYGYNRLRAALEIIKTDPTFRLEIKVYDGLNDRDAFLMNLRENMIRSEISAIDNAYNIRKLVNNYGFDHAAVAELYKRGPKWVATTLSLLTLPESVKDAVADGDISRETGVLLTQLPEAEAEAALAEGMKIVSLEEALEAESDADADTLGLTPNASAELGLETSSLTVDDASLADAIGQLPSRPKAAAKAKKKIKDLTPAEVQSRKTVKQARLSKAVRKAAEAKGVKARKTHSDLVALIKGREDDLSRKLCGYFAGDVSEDDLIWALDTSESPIVTTPKKVKAVGPVKSLA